MKIAAVLVSFDTRRSPIRAIEQVTDLVDQVMIVDNRPASVAPLQPLRAGPAMIIENHNVGGLAGAYNRAVAWLAEHRKDITHVLFLDDDTDVSALAAFLRSQVTIDAASRPEVAAVAPVYRDRRTGLRGRHIQLDRFWFRFLPREQEGQVEVTFVINSMSLWRREALTVIGPYSVSLGVDHIDTDYALRAKREGYKIVLNATVEFLHEIGNRRAYRFFGRVVQSGGHDHARRFQIGRNTALIAKWYGPSHPAFLFLCLQRLAYETVGIVAVEDRKIAKMTALWRGVARGIVTRA